MPETKIYWAHEVPTNIIAIDVKIQTINSVRKKARTAVTKTVLKCPTYYYRYSSGSVLMMIMMTTMMIMVFSHELGPLESSPLSQTRLKPNNNDNNDDDTNNNNKMLARGARSKHDAHQTRPFSGLSPSGTPTRRS